jgi:periodic tryptophan protein 1
VSISLVRANQQGKVFTTRFSPDPETPLTLAAAGSNATVQIWDVAQNVGARTAFGQRLKRYGRELGEIKQGQGLVGIVDVDEEED